MISKEVMAEGNDLQGPENENPTPTIPEVTQAEANRRLEAAARRAGIPPEQPSTEPRHTASALEKASQNLNEVSALFKEMLEKAEPLRQARQLNEDRLRDAMRPPTDPQERAMWDTRWDPEALREAARINAGEIIPETEITSSEQPVDEPTETVTIYIGGYPRPLQLPISPEGKISWMRERLGRLENVPGSFGEGINLQMANEIGGVIQSPDLDPVMRARMSAEFSARQITHEYFQVYRRSASKESLVNIADSLNPAYLNTIMHIPEVGQSFNQLEANAEDWLRARGSGYETARRWIALQAAIKAGEITIDPAIQNNLTEETRRLKDAEVRLYDFSVGIEKQRLDPEKDKDKLKELFKTQKGIADEVDAFGENIREIKLSCINADEAKKAIENRLWSVRLAERIWRITGRAVAHDKIEVMPGKPGRRRLIGEGSGADFVLRRVIKNWEWAIASDARALKEFIDPESKEKSFSLRVNDFLSDNLSGSIMFPGLNDYFKEYVGNLEEEDPKYKEKIEEAHSHFKERFGCEVEWKDWDPLDSTKVKTIKRVVSTEDFDWNAAEPDPTRPDKLKFKIDFNAIGANYGIYWGFYINSAENARLQVMGKAEGLFRRPGWESLKELMNTFDYDGDPGQQGLDMKEDLLKRLVYFLRFRNRAVFKAENYDYVSADGFIDSVIRLGFLPKVREERIKKETLTWANGVFDGSRVSRGIRKLFHYLSIWDFLTGMIGRGAKETVK